MLLLIAAIGTTRMACDEGRKAFTPPRGPFSLHPELPINQFADLAATAIMVGEREARRNASR
jgi:hypothetical protein